MKSLDDILQMANNVQAQLAQAQEGLDKIEVEGVSGGGLVKVAGTGDGQVTSVTIDPKVVDPEDVETLQDLVLGALSDLTNNTAALAQQKMGPLSGGLPF